MTTHAIPTTFRGVRFRSRLEARLAAVGRGQPVEPTRTPDLDLGGLPRPVQGVESRTCEWCSNPIEGNRPDARYCSSWCYRRAWAATQGTPIVAGECEGCGELLTGRRSDAQWCSERCRSRSRREAGG
jgi:hypothetical protein